MLPFWVESHSIRFFPHFGWNGVKYPSLIDIGREPALFLAVIGYLPSMAEWNGDSGFQPHLSRAEISKHPFESHAGLSKVACASTAGSMVCKVCEASVRSTAVIPMSKHSAQGLEKCRELRVWTFSHSTQRETFSRNWRVWDVVSTLCTRFLITVTLVSVLVFVHNAVLPCEEVSPKWPISFSL